MEECSCLSRCPPVSWFFNEAPGDFGAPMFKRAAQDRRGFAAKPLARRKRTEAVGNGASFDDRALLSQALVTAGRHAASLACNRQPRTDQISVFWTKKELQLYRSRCNCGSRLSKTKRGAASSLCNAAISPLRATHLP
jgi:hypothetical protein